MNGRSSCSRVYVLLGLYPVPTLVEQPYILHHCPKLLKQKTLIFQIQKILLSITIFNMNPRGRKTMWKKINNVAHRRGGNSDPVNYPPKNKDKKQYPNHGFCSRGRRSSKFDHVPCFSSNCFTCKLSEKQLLLKIKNEKNKKLKI